MKRPCQIFILAAFIATASLPLYAHSGRTDSSGGHHDRISGGYHYHHGMGPHQHPNGVCPYSSSKPDSAKFNIKSTGATWIPWAQNSDSRPSVPTHASLPGPNISSPKEKQIQLRMDVSCVQARLKELGYYGMKVDGDWGKGSKAALRSFKVANQLPDDAIWDQQTETRLFTSDVSHSKDSSVREEGTSQPGLSIERHGESAKEQKQGKSAESYLSKGRSLVGADDEKAIEAIKQALRIKPDYAEAYEALGVAYWNLDRYGDAIVAYKEALRIKPDVASTYGLLGDVYARVKRHEDAIEAYKQAIRIDPNDACAHNGLGEAYEGLGQPPVGPSTQERMDFWKKCCQDATDEYKQAIRIKPDYAEAHSNLGRSYGCLGRHTEAIEAYKQAIRIKPDDVEAHNGLGMAYYNLSRYAEAIETYKQAIRIKPGDVEAHYFLGGTYVLINDRGSALEEYKILKELDAEQANKLFNEIYK